MNQGEFDHLLEAIKEGEGWRSKPYDDKTGKEIKWDGLKGNPTVCYGWHLTNRIPTEVGLFLLKYTINEYIHELTRNYDWFIKMGGHRQAAVSNMYYILGLYRFGGFRKMIAALEAEKYDTAYHECLDSVWAREDDSDRPEIIAESIRYNHPMKIRWKIR